jgi:hypothetical protein
MPVSGRRVPWHLPHRMPGLLWLWADLDFGAIIRAYGGQKWRPIRKNHGPPECIPVGWMKMPGNPSAGPRGMTSNSRVGQGPILKMVRRIRECASQGHRQPDSCSSSVIIASGVEDRRPACSRNRPADPVWRPAPHPSSTAAPSPPDSVRHDLGPGCCWFMNRCLYRTVEDLCDLFDATGEDAFIRHMH